MSEQKLTGYPSIDKPWLKYYSEEAINAPLPQGSLYDYMHSCNSDRPNDVAISFYGKDITYQQFFDRIEVCAKALAFRGVKKGDIVSVCMLTTPEVLILLYAINRIGAVCNFLVLNATIPEIRKQLQQTNSKIVFSINLAASKVWEAMDDTEASELIVVPITASMPIIPQVVARIKSRKLKRPGKAVLWQDFLAAGKNTILPKVSIENDDLAVLEYTSGTTGESKGVMLSNQAINTVAFHYIAADTVFEFHKGEKFLCFVPPFLAVGLVSTLIMPLCVGVHLILIPDPNPLLTAENVIKYRPAHLIGGPLHIANLMESPKTQNIDLSFLVTVAYGGDKADENWEERVFEWLCTHGVRFGIVNGYGLTEVAGSFCTSTHKTDFSIPLVKNNIFVRNLETGEECKYGEEGEIFVSGPSLMTGYYKNQGATDVVMLEKDGIRWMRTGDLGYMSENGAFHITGRIKRIFSRVGSDGITYRVYPMKIEQVICTHPDVKACAVVGIKDSRQQYLPIAYVIPENIITNTESLKKSILSLCNKNLDDVSIPWEICCMGEFPTTRAGKIDYQKLEEMAKELQIN